MVSYLIFKSSSHFELIFVYDMRVWSNFIVLHSAVQLFHHDLLKRLFFSIVYSCLFCWKLIDCRCVGLFLGSLFFSIVHVCFCVFFPFLSWLFLSLRSSLNILDVNPYQIYVCWPFTLLILHFDAYKFLIFIKSNLSLFLFCW